MRGLLGPAVLLLMLAGASGAQTFLGEGDTVHIFNTDQAVLEAQEPRKDLPCTVTPEKPVLGFDLRFHTGYTVTVPLGDFAGSDNLLTLLFRVIPENHKDEPVYFIQHVRVPSIEDDARGDAYLQGSFDAGEGNYHVDWLMRDRAERVCSFYWDTQASLAPKDKQMALNIAPGMVHKTDGEEFKDDPPIERIQNEPPLDVKIMINFAPQDSLSAALRPSDTAALVSILRSISRDPHIGKFSVVAFNMQEQRILYRQEDAGRIDFPALGDALNSLNLGTVDVKRLGQKHGDTDFLTDLIKHEIGGPDRPDALVFAGPKVMLDENVPQDSLKQIGDLEYPVFYMNYNLNPQAAPWKDSISRAVRFFKGTEFTISRPRDLWYAVSEMVSRIVKSKQGRQVAAESSQ
ncbi:MAG: acetyltransferase [Bryobacteraceae bacterium]